jgi:release factor glutamine methyltransferase
MKLQAALQQASEILARAGLSDARASAELLLQHTLRRERVFLFAHPEYELTSLEWLRYGRALSERLEGRPVQHLVGHLEFFGREFTVSEAALIPRPETEHVVEHALDVAAGARRVLDIGTGTGILAITLALELKARAVATDLSFEAIELARKNARALAAPVEFVQCDLASAVGGPFDLIVSNPPYIPAAEIPTLQREVRDYEPHLALLGGERGTELYPRIIKQAEQLLPPGGWLIFEIGHRGEADVRGAFGAGWSNVTVGHDLAGLPRVVRGRRAETGLNAGASSK